MVTISLCMIVRDEETVLERCLESVRGIADEVVLVDTGSRDQTKKIGEKYADRIYDFPWTGNFSEARNFALSKGQMDYLMWLDADDVLPPESGEKLLRLKESLPEDVSMILMPYHVSFDERGTSTFSYYRERIVKRGEDHWFQGKVHEVIPLSGRLYYTDIPVEHRKIKEGSGDRNLKIYEGMEAMGESFDARALYYYGRELLYYGQYEKGAKILEEFLESPEGWVENKIDGTRQLARCRYGLGQEEKALEALLRGLIYDVPRGETCCDLGRHFLERERYEQAAYWYLQALTAKKDRESGAFIQEECYGFLPAIMLCVCYDRMGERSMAQFYNELAGKYKPDDPGYLWNKKYFEREK